MKWKWNMILMAWKEKNIDNSELKEWCEMKIKEWNRMEWMENYNNWKEIKKTINKTNGMEED